MTNELNLGKRYWFESYASMKEAIHADCDSISDQYQKEVIALAWATRLTFLKGDMPRAVFDEITHKLITAEEELEAVAYDELDPMESSKQAALVMQRAHTPLNNFLYPLPKKRGRKSKYA